MMLAGLFFKKDEHFVGQLEGPRKGGSSGPGWRGGAV